MLILVVCIGIPVFGSAYLIYCTGYEYYLESSVVDKDSLVCSALNTMRQEVYARRLVSESDIETELHAVGFTRMPMLQ